MPSTQQPTRHHALRRLVAILAAAVVALELAYLIGANAFLSSEWGRETLNRRPQTLQITWEKAWTWVPGLVHVRVLEIRGGARRAEWRAAADSGRMVVFLPSLLRHHVRLLRGRAHGAEIDVRILPAPDTPRPERQKRPWKVSLDALVLEPLRAFRLNDYEIAGDGHAEGWARFAVRGFAELELTSLSFDNAAVLDRGQTAAEALILDGRFRMEPFVVGDDTIEDLLAGLTGEIALDTEASGLGFLASYLDRAPWLRLGGSGHLVADIEVTGGWMAPGSRLTLDGPTIGADFFGLEARGEGRLEGFVPAGAAHTELSVRLPTYSLSRQADHVRLLEGQALEIVVSNDSTAIDRPAEGITLDLEVPPARVPDLAAFSFYLPEATGLAVTGGSGEVEASLHYSAVRGGGDGRIRLKGRQVQAAFEDVDLRADIEIDSRLSDIRLEDGRIDLGGTRLQIENVTTREEGRLRDSGWWGTIQLPTGRLFMNLGDPQAPAALLEGEVTAELRDTGPLVALLQQYVPRLSWIDRLLTVQNVKGTSNLRIQGPRISLADLAITGGKKDRLEILGDLDLAQNDPSGVFFARWGALSAAVSLAEGDRDWKLTRSRRWYDRNLASYRQSRVAGAPR